MQREGRCLCGSVHFTAQIEGTGFGACHCAMCRRWCGGPFLSLRTVGVQWHSDASVRTFRSSDWAERGYCGECGSSLFYRIVTPGSDPGRIHLAVGSLDDATGLRLTTEVFIDHKPPGYDFAGELQRLTEAEIFSRYGPD